MKISIITVSFNSEQTIEQTIQSVLSQSYPDVEYIVIDGQSNDGTLAIVNTYQDQIQTIVSEKDQGIYDAMNKGIEKATGEVVGILNSDDLYSDQHVLSEIAGIFQDPEIDGAYADLEYVAADDLRHVKRNWVSGYYKPGSFVKGWMPPHPTFFVRRKLYTALGNYNTDFRISADYELMLRFIHKHEIKLAYLPRSIIKMRVGGKSNATLKNRIQANKEDRKAWRINGLKPAVFTHFRKPLSKLVQFFPQSK